MLVQTLNILIRVYIHIYIYICFSSVCAEDASVLYLMGRDLARPRYDIDYYVCVCIYICVHIYIYIYIHHY